MHKKKTCMYYAYLSAFDMGGKNYHEISFTQSILSIDADG